MRACSLVGAVVTWVLWSEPTDQLPSAVAMHTCHAWLLLSCCPFTQSHVPSMMTYICINSLLADWIHQPIAQHSHTGRSCGGRLSDELKGWSRVEMELLPAVHWLCVAFTLCVSDLAFSAISFRQIWREKKKRRVAKRNTEKGINK